MVAPASKPSRITTVFMACMIMFTIAILVNPEVEAMVEEKVEVIGKRLGLDKVRDLESPYRECIQVALVVLIVLTGCWGNLPCLQRRAASADDKSEEDKKSRGKAGSPGEKFGDDIEGGMSEVESSRAVYGGHAGVINGLAGMVSTVRAGASAGYRTALARGNSARAACKTFTEDVLLPRLRDHAKLVYLSCGALFTAGCVYWIIREKIVEIDTNKVAKVLDQLHINYDYTRTQDNVELAILVMLCVFVACGRSPSEIAANSRRTALWLAGPLSHASGGAGGVAEAERGGLGSSWDAQAVFLASKEKAAAVLVAARQHSALAKQKAVAAAVASIEFLRNIKLLPDLKLFLGMSLLAVTRKPIKSVGKAAIISVQAFAIFRMLDQSVSLWSAYTYSSLVCLLVSLHVFPFDPWDSEYVETTLDFKDSTARLVKLCLTAMAALAVPAMYVGRIA